MKLDKTQAIEQCNQQLGRPVLSSDNSLFAELDRKRSIWWFDIPHGHLKSLRWLNLLLNNSESGQVLHLMVPTTFLRERLAGLEVRNAGKRNCTISLELSADRDAYLKDMRPKGSHVGFAEFVQG